MCSTALARLAKLIQSARWLGCVTMKQQTKLKVK